MPSERDDGHASERLDVAPRTDQRRIPDVAAEELAESDQRRRRRPSRVRPGVVAAIATGGTLGAVARYGVAQLVPVAPASFPWATFWTNVSGSLVLGAVLMLIAERFPPSRYLRPFLATGFLGAYTTYSTFAVQTDALVKDGQVATALAYLAASLGAGLAAGWLGIAAARLLPFGRKGGRG